MSYQQEKFKEIADAIREKTGSKDAIKPSEFASMQQEVFDAGKKAEYDAFWDAIQMNGTRRAYNFAFGNMWGDVFYPKYDLIATSTASNMFYKFNYGGAVPIDLAERIDERGLKLDLSEATSLQLIFGYAKISRVGVVDFSNVVNLDRCFLDNSLLTTIDKIIVSEKNIFINTYGSTFHKLTALEEIRFEGVIASSIDLHWSPLSKESVESVVSALSDTVSGQTITLNNEKMYGIHNMQIQAGNLNWWDDLTATKPNWTFALADV